MKKVLMLLVLLVVLTGCSINRLDFDNIDSLISSIEKNSNKLVNTVSVGYKYYVPAGISIVDKSSYNEKLYYNGEYYYLYVDVVSYYNKVKEEHIINEDLYYSKEIENNGKKGYIEIQKLKDEYFINAYYNYAKIEAYVSEKNLKNSIINIGYILLSIRFNESVTELVVGKEELKLGEEKFSIFKPKRKEGSFLDYVEEFDKYNNDIIIGEENSINELGNNNESYDGFYNGLDNQNE